MLSNLTRILTLTLTATTVFIGTGMASTASVAANQTPLQVALNRTTDGVPYRYEVDYESEDVVSHYSVDPTKPLGERVNVSSPPRSQWGSDFLLALNEVDAEADTKFWCTAFAENIPQDVVPLSQTDTTITYEFVPVATEEDDEDIMPNLTGRVTVTKVDPAIVEYRIYAEQSFKPAWIARMNHFDIHAHCERLPDGRTHVKSMKVTISGKIGFKEFSGYEKWNISSITPAL